MPRRFVLVPVAIVLLACAQRSSPPGSAAPSGSAPSEAGVATPEMRELTADQQVVHVLNRLAFGPRPGDVQRVRELGVDRWIAQQLQPARIDDGRTTQFISQSYRTVGMSTSDLVREGSRAEEALRQQRRERAMAMGDSARPDSMRAEAPVPDAAAAQLRRTAAQSLPELQSAKVARAVMSERQLEEVMVDFWENHFSVFGGKGPVRWFLPAYTRDVVRPHALGSFRDLLGAVASSPAMLFYLDNWQSAADSGRPVLGTQGRRGVPVGPGRRGIRARQMPPERLQPPPLPAGRRRPGLNENYARELLELHTVGVDGGYTQQDVIEVARAFTGWSLEEPRRSGEFVFRPIVHDAGEKQVLGVRLPAGRGVEDGEQVLDIVARHPSTARHIATKLATRFVSDTPPEALIERAAATFMRTDGDIREVVRTIVTSPEFFSRAAYRAKVKSPFEVVVSALRALGAEPDATPRTAQVVARLGQPLYMHEAPNGWPETGEAWINAGAILNRINFGMQVAAGRLPGAAPRRWPPARELARATREQQVDGVIAALFNGEVSSDTRAILLAGENPLGRDDGVEAMAAPRTDGLLQILGLALGAPEFQRR